ncbi:hypothetical protein ACSBR1_036243 [Camellia fascicularis]
MSLSRTYIYDLAGFSFEEFGSIHASKGKVLCCHFSSDGKLLASAGHDKKGATRQVQSQPHIGNLLAAASRNKISLIDVETNRLQCYLKGHDKEVRSICWDISGKYMAFVSEDSAQIWSIVSGGKCVHVFHSNGIKFESGAFHPGYSQLMVIGSYKAINMWNPAESNKTMTVGEAHDGIVASLADCSQTEIVASVSHDRIVKRWR